MKSVVSRSRDESECVDKRKENHKENVRKFEKLTNFQVDTATWCVFACDCMWTQFQMSRIVETYTRSCQNSSLSNTQEIRNILIGSLFENEQGGEPVILHDGVRA